MKRYVVDLQPNEDVTSYFLLKEPIKVRKSKKQTDYLCMRLGDRTGDLDSRVWDIPPDFHPTEVAVGDILKVRAKVDEWSGDLQLQVSQVRRVNGTDDVDLGDFYEKSERDPDEMYEELTTILRENIECGSNMHLLLAKILVRNKEAFCMVPAAKSIHHGYLSGLLEHTLSLCETALLISKRYKLRTDLMLAACVLHDIGKCRELTYPIASYTTEGTLLGHVVIGLGMVQEVISEIKGFPPELAMRILHLVASHHGRMEWGSPKVPLTKEAVAFHLIDMIDSRMAVCDKAIRDGVDQEGMTDWVKALDGPLYVGTSAGNSERPKLEVST